MLAATLPVAAAHEEPRRAYVLTDHLNVGADGFAWGVGVSHSNDDVGIRCYASPKLAALMNPLRERFRLPRVWEANVDRELEPGEGVVSREQVETVRQVSVAPMTAQDYARFAAMCAQAAFTSGELAEEFSQWVESWLAGMDNSGVAARVMADRLESESSREDHEQLMAANAARAAMQAARTTWLAGRARDEEIARAAELAAEAVDMALRLANFDAAELAERAVKSPAAALSIR